MTAERILLCIQCGVEYRASENAEGACKFHAAQPVGGWTARLNCCGKEHRSWDAAYADRDGGCIRGVHRDAHHTEYPYSTYFKHIGQQMRTLPETHWLEVVAEDLEDDMPKRAFFGRAADGRFYVGVTKGNFNLFLAQLTADEVAHAATAAAAGSVEIVHRGSGHLPGEFDQSTPDSQWAVRAWWLVGGGRVTGVRLAASSLSQPLATEKELDFDPVKGEPGAVRVIAQSTAASDAPPSDPELLPPREQSFTPFPAAAFAERKEQPTFPTLCTGALNLRFKRMEPCRANPQISPFKSDNFVVDVSIIHQGRPLPAASGAAASQQERVLVLQMVRDRVISVDDAVRLLAAVDVSVATAQGVTAAGAHAGGETAAIRVIELRAEAKLAGAADWTPVTATLVHGELPFVIEPNAVVRQQLVIGVPAPDKTGSWFDRAWVARLGPVQLRFTIEDVNGDTATSEAVFQNPPSRSAEREADDLFYLAVDSLRDWERVVLRVKKANDASDFTVKLPNQTFEVSRALLRKWAYQARKTKTSQFKVEDMCTGLLQTHALVSSKVHGYEDSCSTRSFARTQTQQVHALLFELRAGEDAFAREAWPIPH